MIEQLARGKVRDVALACPTSRAASCSIIEGDLLRIRRPTVEARRMRRDGRPTTLRRSSGERQVTRSVNFRDGADQERARTRGDPATPKSEHGGRS